MAQNPKKRKNGWPKGIFRDIYVCSKQELSPFGVVFVFGADNVEEKNLGTIFGIIKIDDRSEGSSYVANLLVSVMKKEYFGKPQRSAEESFEVSLRKANLALAELARHGSLGWSGKISFASGALARNNLHFACLGGVSVHLLRDGQIVDIGQDLAEEKGEQPHPLKTFSNISSGKLENGDKLVFATRDLSDVFSREELRQNASHFSREEFPGFLEMSLQANAELAGAIVIDLVEETEISRAAPEAPVVEKRETPKFSDSATENAEQAKKIDAFASFPEKKYPPVSERLSVSEDEVRESSWRKFTVFSKNIFARATDATKLFLLKLITFLKGERQKDLSRTVFKKPVSAFLRSGRKIGESLTGAKNMFQALAPERKNFYLKIFGGILAIAIVAFFVSSRIKKTAEPAPQPENAPVETQPALPIDDIEARKIENMEEFSDFAQEEARIALLENFLYAVSGKDKSVARINLETKIVEEIKSDLPVGNFELLSAMPHLKTLFLLTGDRKVISFTSVNKNFQENGISLPGNLKSRDIRSYLTYLYVLDTANNQIYRYPRAEGGFGEGQSWLRSATDLKDAKSIAVNDDLYLAESGKITAYIQGKKDEKVNFEAPRTPLSIDRIFSEPDMEFVWILDSKNRRVIKYSKDGKIIAQYFSESILDVKDFVVDEKNKTVYLLKNNQLLKLFIE
ncbi:MAG: hypothetical protein QMD77_03470 [Patescibacteria group bacterium]|nr:hypothetical protein [Patescibacteria group bacterium]